MQASVKIESNPRRTKLEVTCPVHEAAGNASMYIDDARRRIKPDGIYRDDGRTEFSTATDVFARNTARDMKTFKYDVVVICFSSIQIGGNLVHTVECNGSKAVITEQF